MLTLQQMSDAIQFAKLVGRLLDSAGRKYSSWVEGEGDKIQVVIYDAHKYGHTLIMDPILGSVQIFSGHTWQSNPVDMDSYGLLQIKELIQEWK